MDTDTKLRLGAFAVVLSVLVVAEAAAPRRKRSHPRTRHWPGNIGIVVLDTVVLRLVFPAAAVGTALAAREAGWGLFNRVLVPGWVAVVLSIVALDAVIYLQHVLFHAVPLLWRFHRMHHADTDIDVTTGLRFHPVEILVSMGIKIGAVAAIGAPVVGVILFEILLNATSLFNHGNIRIPESIDRWLRWLVVTPDMHRVHHSVLRWETNSNFGFNLPWWDRLFGTYRAQPKAGHTGMTIGLEEFRDTRWLRLDRLLWIPFVRGHDPYPIGRDSLPPDGDSSE